MTSKAGRRKLQKYFLLNRNERPPSVKRRRTAFARLSGQCEFGAVSTIRKDRVGPLSILSIPPELLDHIICDLSVRDVVMLGQTCHYLHQFCSSDTVWKRISKKLSPRLTEGPCNNTHWKRASILNYTKGLYFQTFGGRRKTVSRTVAPHLSHGYRKFIPTKDNVFILDYMGTLFFLKNALVSSTLGQIQWKRACRYVVLCRNVKDFATDPRNDTIYRKYLYVLGTRDIPPLVTQDTSDTAHTCDCVEVYLQSSGQRVFKMTFHSSMRFKKIKLVGQETERSLLLLTDDGKIYSLTINETQLDQPRSYTVQLSTRKITKCLPHITISEVHSNQSSALYITDSGAVYLEVHTAGVYRDLFGTLHAFDPFDQQIPLALALSSKVTSCSLGYNHLGLVDEFGRIFMQGNNRYGQLGTGDKIDRGEPTLVPYLKRPLDIWCGLNHSLVLSQGSDYSKEIHGCGCGAGGRLPGFPKGSAFFVKLYVQVPHCTKVLCSTRECLYMLACYDISDVLVFRELPCTKGRSQGLDSEMETSQMCTHYLKQLESCCNLDEQIDKMKEIINQMGLCGYQKDFLQDALSTLQRSTGVSVAVTTQDSSTL
ncbi:F-box only protein 24-like [Hemiscyllium ocellatum]|uniref:F-box only protein 24-like n=1 Tax=Hemiscyllium ocellatum TaxID=170820 RepID=UPI0029665E74|nr:F-box only protein 24-like [Hemiscyllium ocellatum]